MKSKSLELPPRTMTNFGDRRRQTTFFHPFQLEKTQRYTRKKTQKKKNLKTAFQIAGRRSLKIDSHLETELFHNCS
ncbi:hypothetical protein CEXT_674221 [Caerostris extrusa]|uniref:Ribosomal protein S18 n=1 Tax=Caerostris extrusa TaxID=172846 RepID=A0AAV4SZI4_CAEEX|nr:hypothetical protein CEXT_674221 [Caerostris extrusa]